MGNVYLTSDTNVAQINEQIEITLNIKDTKTVSFTSELYFDETKLEYVSGPENTNLVDNHIILVWYDTTGGNSPKDGELAKFIFRAKDDGIANFTILGEFYNENTEVIQADFSGVQVQIGESEVALTNEVIEEPGITTDQNNTNLETLAIENTLLYPAFDNTVTSYRAEVSNSTTYLNILAIPEIETAKAEIVWDNELKEGNNLISVNVTASDGVTKKTYEINVYKRNQEEEAIYQAEQQENQERLEEIYNTENVSANTSVREDTNQGTEVEKKANGLMIVISIVIAVFVLFVVFKFWKKFWKKPSRH